MLSNRMMMTAKGLELDEFTKALLHFNGPDASTVFKDETEKRAWTAGGGAKISTAQSKFGGSSAQFGGSDYIDTPAQADFNVGFGDFTVDFWARSNLPNTTSWFCGQINSTFGNTSKSMTIGIFSNAARIIIWADINKTATSAAGAISDTNWHHIAAVRYGTILRIAVDGVFGAEVDVSSLAVIASTNKFAIGRAGEYPSQGFDGNIDEFRFSKGIARWTENFTPPTGEY